MADYPTQQVDRVAAVLQRHVNVTRRATVQVRQGFIRNATACKGCDWEADTIDYAAHERHVAEAVCAALDAATPALLGELKATKALLAATQEMHSRTIADFCALRDSMPRKQVEQILGSVGERNQ